MDDRMTMRVVGDSRMIAV